jgi:hypothetical protein
MIVSARLHAGLYSGLVFLIASITGIVAGHAIVL